MSKRIVYSIILILTFTAGIICIRPYTAFAYSASVWFETNQEVIYEGEEFEVILCISTDDTLGNFEGTISYNDSMIEFISGPACILGSDGILEVKDISASSSWDIRQYVLMFKALKSGTSLIQMVNDIAAYEYDGGKSMSVSSSVFQLDVTTSFETAINAKLSIMKISQGVLTPSFSSDIYEYQIIVGYDTEKLIISAIPEDLTSVVNVKGNSSLKEGDNEVEVLVTSPSGVLQIYTIYVYKESKALESLEPEEEKAAEDEPEWRFMVTSEDSSVLIQGQYYYKLKDKPPDIVIPEGYVKSRMLINKIPINIYVEETEETPEFFLLILENEAGITSLYRYDRVEKTVQRYKGDEGEEAKGISRLEEQSLLQDAQDLVKYNETIGSLSLLTGFSWAVSVLLLIIVIILVVKVVKNRYEEADY